MRLSNLADAFLPRCNRWVINFLMVFTSLMMYPPTPYDIRFRFCGFPVRVHPLFWIVSLLLGIGSPIEELPVWFLNLALWVAAVFVSILLHEWGHAAVFSYVLRVPAQIVLGFGGVTIPMYPHRRQHTWTGFFKEVFLFAAGPFAGFVLAALVILFWQTAGVPDDELFDLSGFHPKAVVQNFLWYLFWISIVWGLFNLLPIYPMDGGHIAREVCNILFQRNGIRYSLFFSMFISVILLVLSLRWGSFFTAVLMGYFAYQNYQELSFRSSGRW